MTQNKNKKGIAKKALSISLVAAMLATSNVPVWASGFEAEGFSLEESTGYDSSETLAATVADLKVDNLTADGCAVVGGNNIIIKSTTTLDTADYSKLTLKVDGAAANTPNEQTTNGQAVADLTYTPAAADFGKKLTAKLIGTSSSGDTVLKSQDFYVVNDAFAQADYIDVFALNSADTSWSKAKTNLLDGVTATIKSSIDAAYEVDSSSYKLVWTDDNTVVTTISANDIGRAVKGIATLQGPGLTADGKTIETASSVTLTADSSDTLITNIKWEGSSEDGKAVYTYDGKEHKPVITSFVYNGKTYKPNSTPGCAAVYGYPSELTDVTKTPPATISANITIDPGFSGTITSDYEIKAISLDGASLSINKEFTYDGTGNYTIDADKEITITKNGKTLKLGTDYDVAVALVDENKVGDQLLITVTGAGNYTGTLTKTMPIKGMDISGWNIVAIDDQVWTGNAITPVLSFEDEMSSNVDLIKDTDYQVSYTKNTEVGTATVTVKGIGNYTGTLTATFEIIANDTVWGELVSALNTDLVASADQNNNEFIYTGKPITWVKDVYESGKFIKGTHFTVTYAPQNTNVGTVKMTVKGKGVYSSKSEVIEYKISEKDVADKDVKVNVANINFVPGISENAIKDAVTVTYNGKTLRENIDFKFGTPTFTNSTFEVTITGIGNFTGTKDITKKVTAKDINTVTLPTIANKVYNGDVYDVTKLGNEFVLKDGTKNLIKDTDYVVVREYNNKNVGMATIEIAGRGNYTGSATINFLIVEKELQGTIVMDNGSPILADQSYSYAVASSDEGIVINGLQVVATDGQILTEGQDYKFEYADNKAVGTATVSAVKVDANKNVLIAKATFRIVPTALEDVDSYSIAGIKTAGYTYTGSPIEPKVTIILKDGKYTLRAGTDYEVSYVNNVSATSDEDPAVVITGKGNYAKIDSNTNKVNALTEPFVINKADITYADVIANDVSYAGGIPVKEDITVKNPESGVALVKDTDYTLDLENNVEVGIATATIELTDEAKDNYTISGNTLPVNFNITKKSLADCKITVKGEEVVVKNGELTVPSTEYEVVKNEDASVTVKAKANSKNYTGEQKVAGIKATTLKVTNRTTSTVSLGWSKVEGAEGYTIWFRSEHDSSVSRKIVTGGDVTKWTQKGLAAGTKYFYTIKAWVKDAEGNYVFSEQSEVQRGTTKPYAAKIKSVTAANGKVKVALTGKAAGAEKYSMCYSKGGSKFNEKKFSVGIRTSYTTRTFSKTLSAGTYYVCVKSYRDLGNGKRVYGAWSNAMKVVVD